MGFRFWRRKMRCLLRYGPRRCPHIERHSRRRRSPRSHRGRRVLPENVLPDKVLPDKVLPDKVQPDRASTEPGRHLAHP